MTQITKAYWLAVQRQVAQYKGEVQRALLQAFNEIAGKLNEKALAQLVVSGGVDRLVSKMLPADDVKAAFSGVSSSVQKTIKRSSENTIKLLPKDARAGTVAFDTLNPNVIAAIDNLNSRVIQDLVTNVRETVKSTVRDGLEAGLPAKAIARDIRESIGLAPNQEKAVRNFETMLRTGNSEVLSRELRDHRFDSAIKRAFDNGAKLSDTQVNKMVDIYRQRFVAFHADTVARTATLDATKLGQNITWQSAIDAGTVEETAMLKRWVGVKDDREREEHLEMEGETVAFDDQFSNGEDIPGDSTYNCRCVAFYFQDPEAARKVAMSGGADEADRAMGIIGTIRSFLESGEGGTIDEIMGQLTSDFPERPAGGMLQTVKTQLNRLSVSTGLQVEKINVEGRGRVFRFVSTKPLPPFVPPPPPIPQPLPLPPGSGIIDTVKWFISRPEGGTVNEILEQLKAAYPERSPEGMLQTIKTQLNRLPKALGREIEKVETEGRGRVFRLLGGGITPPVPPIGKEPPVPKAPLKPKTVKVSKDQAIANIDQMLRPATREELDAAGKPYTATRPDYYSIRNLFEHAPNGVSSAFDTGGTARQLVSAVARNPKFEPINAPIQRIALDKIAVQHQFVDKNILLRQLNKGLPKIEKKFPVVFKYGGKYYAQEYNPDVYVAARLHGLTELSVHVVDLDTGLAFMARGGSIADAQELMITGRTTTAEEKAVARFKATTESFSSNPFAKEVWDTYSKREQQFFADHDYTFKIKSLKKDHALGMFYSHGDGFTHAPVVSVDSTHMERGLLAKKNGPFWDTRDTHFTVAHEMGHGVDYAWGVKLGEEDSRALYSGRRAYWSDMKDNPTAIAYRKALAEDIAAAKSRPGGGAGEVATQYDAWLRRVYKTSPGEHSYNVETVADLVASIRNNSYVRKEWQGEAMIRAFPKASKIIREMLAHGLGD